MPFKSTKQRAFLFAKHPEIAKKWVKKYGSEIGGGTPFSSLSKDDKIANINAQQAAFFSTGPHLLNQLAQRAAKSPNRVVSTIGRVARIPTSLFAPPEQDIQAIRIGVSNPSSLTPSQRSLLSNRSISSFAGLAAPLSRQKVTSIIPRMSGEDQQFMTNLIDLSRTRKIKGVRPTPQQAVEAEKWARYVAEGMGINPDVRNAELANRFEQILNALRSKTRR